VPKPLIIGFDPGLTTAWAAIDLKGQLVAEKEGRSLSLSEVARAAKEAGRPLIVAVDKEKAPEAAAKLASSFSCQLWTPQQDMGVDEKSSMVREAVKEWELEPVPTYSSHEKSAIAAALACYKSLATSFTKIEDSLTSLGMQQHAEQVKVLLLTKRAKNIDEAIAALRPKPPAEQRPMPAQQPTNINNKAYREEVLERKVRSLENSLDIQKAYIAKLESKLAELEKSKKQMVEERLKQTAEARKEVLKDKDLQLREQIVCNLRNQVLQLNKENEHLAREIERRDELQQLIEDDRVPLVPVAEWSREKLAETDKVYKLRDKLAWIEQFRESNAALRYCNALGVKGVVGRIDDETAEKMKRAGLIVVTGLVPARGKWWASASKDEFEDALKASERSGFIGWLAGYRKRGVL
jgi:predicted RNase H-like nuclease (RuvC/YqgF family)